MFEFKINKKMNANKDESTREWIVDEHKSEQIEHRFTDKFRSDILFIDYHENLWWPDQRAAELSVSGSEKYEVTK